LNGINCAVLTYGQTGSGKLLIKKKKLIIFVNFVQIREKSACISWSDIYTRWSRKITIETIDSFVVNSNFREPSCFYIVTFPSANY